MSLLLRNTKPFSLTNYNPQPKVASHLASLLMWTDHHLSTSREGVHNWRSPAPKSEGITQITPVPQCPTSLQALRAQPHAARVTSTGDVVVPAIFLQKHFPTALVPKQLNIVIEVDGVMSKVIQDGESVNECHATMITHQHGTHYASGLWPVYKKYPGHTVLGWAMEDVSMGRLRLLLSSPGPHMAA